MAELSRREFVAAASIAAAACLTAFACPASVLADDAPAKTLDIGAKADYAKDGVTSTWIKSDSVVVVRHDGKIYAFTAICTHKGAIIEVTGDHLTCPKHHSTFKLDGSVIQGKAPSSLNHYGISADANGHLIVDKAKIFSDDKWADPASFVPVDAPK